VRRHLFTLLATFSLAIFCFLGAAMSPPVRSARAMRAPIVHLSAGDWNFYITDVNTTIFRDKSNARAGALFSNWGNEFAYVWNESLRYSAAPLYRHRIGLTVSHFVTAPLSLVLPAMWFIQWRRSKRNPRDPGFPIETASE
jgi:hypothetical protein